MADQLETGRPDPGSIKSSVRAAAEAAREQIRQGAATTRMNEPKIGERGSVPQAGAGAHEGERPAQQAAAPAATEVTFLEDEEVVEALEGAPEEQEQEQAGEQEAAPAEGEQDAAPEDGEVQEEVAPIELPPVREGQQPIEVDIDDPDTEQRIRNLIKGNLRRERYQEAARAVEQREEHLAQFEDALRVDPISLIIERTNEQTQADLAVSLYHLPHVQQRLREIYGDEGDENTVRAKGIELENARLRRRSDTVGELNRRSDYRARGREVRQGIQRIIPDDMDAETAQLLSKDLERDVTEYILANPRAANLRVADLPDILARRLALHGITPEEAADRLDDTGVAPLPIGARAAARTTGAPARRPKQQQARTGKDVVAQANARRRAGAVPGGGAGIPAAGVVLPRKQGVKARIESLKEMLLGK